MKAGPTISRKKFGVLILGIAVLVAGVLLLVDGEEFTRVIGEADWRPLPGAFLFTIVSYVCVGYAFALVSKMLGIRMRKRDLTQIGYVSTILNHVVSTGGVAGYSVRYFLMNRFGAVLEDVVTASILHFYLTSLDMLAILPIGFLYLTINASIPRGVTIALSLMTFLLALVAIGATLLIFSNPLRKALLERAARWVETLTRKEVRPLLTDFDAAMQKGVAVLRDQPRTVALVMVLTFIDWISSVIVLGLCFDALGPPVGAGALMSGFVIGVMAGVVSMVPGGIGVQEGSMAGIFALLGVSFGQALLASILFRGIYYLIPYLASLGFYWRLLRRPVQELPAD